MINECECYKGFTPKMIPCPDGREGCMVAHYDKSSFICPKCGFDHHEWIKKAFLEGRVHEEIGMAVINTRGINKLTVD